MKNSYYELISQNYNFPQEGFDLSDGHLTFHGVNIKKLIDKYGSPFKLLYLPKIGEQIEKARNHFDQAIEKYKYGGEYNYCYCTKSCHFAFVLETALKENVHLETSSSFDIDIILRLLESGKLTKDITLIHNGYKTDAYLRKILKLNKEGFTNSILVLDSKFELARIKKIAEDYQGSLQIGIRMAIDEHPQSSHHTSRLGLSLIHI